MQLSYESLANRSKLLTILSFILVLISGFLGYSLFVENGTISPNLLTSTVNGNANDEVISLIKTDYLEDTSDVDFDEGELRGYVNALEDPYSEYLSEEDWKKFEEALNENYVGIGIRFNNTIEGYVVDEIIANSPAEQSGLKQGDILYKIDGTLTTEIPFEKLADTIKGEEGTVVQITVLRENQEQSFTITRSPIQVEQLMLDIQDDIAVITISSFGENVASKMESAARTINEKNIKKVVLDVRSNGGGLLDEAIDIASYFLEPGEVVLREKSKDSQQDFASSAKSPNLQDVEVIVVQDKYSASASEILAGALREQDDSKIVGEKSFGKGVVQRVYPLSNKGKLKLTIAEWLTPEGNTINKTGLIPDISVKQDEDAISIAKQQFNN
jgi:carboxyl-terminal processing protease